MVLSVAAKAAKIAAKKVAIAKAHRIKKTPKGQSLKQHQARLRVARDKGIPLNKQDREILKLNPTNEKRIRKLNRVKKVLTPKRLANQQQEAKNTNILFDRGFPMSLADRMTRLDIATTVKFRHQPGEGLIDGQRKFLRFSSKRRKRYEAPEGEIIPFTRPKRHLPRWSPLAFAGAGFGGAAAIGYYFHNIHDPKKKGGSK